MKSLKIISFIILITSLFHLSACNKKPSCSDGIQNQGELGIDCNGPCPGDCDCFNGIRDGNEFKPDCGGKVCPCCNPACNNECKFPYVETGSYQISGGLSVMVKPKAFVNQSGNLVVRLENVYESGKVEITQNTSNLKEGYYFLNRGSIEIIFVGATVSYTSLKKGTSGFVDFSEFVNKHDCKYVSGHFNVQIISQFSNNKLNLFGEFLEIPFD